MALVCDKLIQRNIIGRTNARRLFSVINFTIPIGIDLFFSTRGFKSEYVSLISRRYNRTHICQLLSVNCSRDPTRYRHIFHVFDI